MKETEETREGNPNQTGPELYLDDLSSTEISEYICGLEREIKSAIESNAIVEQERLLLQKKILELQTRKKDLDIEIGRAHV